jgi:hypothetical protein
MKQILTILIATILLFSSCDKTYNNYEITYWDNTKDTLYQIKNLPFQYIRPYEGCISYYDTTESIQSTCYIKSIKLIK